MSIEAIGDREAVDSVALYFVVLAEFEGHVGGEVEADVLYILNASFVRFCWSRYSLVRR